MYNKIFTRILDSSIWLESHATRIVWMTLLAAMDEDGYAHFAAVANLAHRARVTLEEAQTAVSCLESPDPNSSDPSRDGRRIERVPGGWMVLNAPKYRELVSRIESLASNRRRVYKHRKLKQLEQCNGPVMTCNENVMESDSGSGSGSVTIAGKEHDPVNGEPCTIDDCINHANFIGLPQSEAEAFFNYYSSIGWMLGGSPVRQWKQLLINWKTRYEQRKHQTSQRSGRPRVDRNQGTYNEGVAKEY